MQKTAGTKEENVFCAASCAVAKIMRGKAIGTIMISSQSGILFLELLKKSK